MSTKRPQYVKVVQSGRGLTFLCRYIPEGGGYGLEDCLSASWPMVEFYDVRYNFTDYGQFISRYDVKTFNEISDGLNLGTFELKDRAVQEVKRWIKEITCHS